MNVNRRPLNTIRTKKSFNNDFNFTQITSQCDPNTEINSLSVKAIPFPLKSGDVLQVNGNDIILTADAAVDGTTLSITSFSPTKTIMLNDWLSINQTDLFVQYQRKTQGSVAGFAIDADGMTKGGIEITSFLDSDTMTGASATSLSTSESIKAYVDANAGGTSNYIMATCSTTALTSATDGIANAVVIPFDTTSVSSDTTTITLYGAAGYESLSGTGYSFKLDTNSRTGKYHIDWNVSVDTSVVNNRYLIGVTLQSMLAQEGETWEELSPSRTWIYNRGTGGNRYGSAGNSIYYNLDTDVNERIFRLVFWKEDGNASGKNITTNDGVSIKIKQL